MAYPFQPMDKRKLLILSGEHENTERAVLVLPTGDEEIFEKPSVKLLPLRNPLSSEENAKYLPT
jgi:hypothetical protein